MELLTSEVFNEYQKSIEFIKKYNMKNISDLEKEETEFRKLSLFSKQYILKLLKKKICSFKYW